MSQHFRVYEGTSVHFITSTVVYWIPVFCRDDYFRVLAESLAYCVRNKGLRVFAYAIMPNHFHLICHHESGLLSATIGDLKKFTSKRIAQKLEEDDRTSWLAAMKQSSWSEGGVRVWTEAFHPEEIYSYDFFSQKANYIHNNPVRTGYVSDIRDWKYSSARFYELNEESIVPITRLEA